MWCTPPWRSGPLEGGNLPPGSPAHQQESPPAGNSCWRQTKIGEIYCKLLLFFFVSVSKKKKIQLLLTKILIIL